MSTRFLRFTDEAEARAALSSYQDDEGNWITASHKHALDVVGTITEGGEWDEEGNVITPPTVLPGYHVNYAGELSVDVSAYEVSPATPSRIFAGG